MDTDLDPPSDIIRVHYMEQDRLNPEHRVKEITPPRVFISLPPMKLLPVVLVGSLAANAALATLFVNRPALAPPALRAFFMPAKTAEPTAAEAKMEAARAERAATRAVAEARAQRSKLWRALHTEDLKTLAAQLRAAGFPTAVVRAIVDAQVEARFAPQIRELKRATEETPYWKPDPTMYSGNSEVFTKLSQIYRERAKVMREVLGQDALAWGATDPTAAQRRQFGDIAPAKIDLVQRINDDYAEMSAQVRTAMQGVTLPEDREKLALLEREKRADLAALLTPQELNDYEMRSSPVTSRLRSALSVMEASEAEFLAIYKIQQPFVDTLYSSSNMVTTRSSFEQRRELTAQVNEQVKAALGEARFLEYQRATNYEYQGLHRMAQVENLPVTAVAQAFDVRASTAEASDKIMNDRSLTPEARTAALQTLAQSAHNQIISAVGPKVGNAYANNAQWLTYIKQGGAISIMPDGNLSYRSANPGPVRPTP